MARFVSKKSHPDIYKYKRNLKYKRNFKWFLLYISLLGNVVLSYPYWQKYVDVAIIKHYLSYIKL